MEELNIYKILYKDPDEIYDYLYSQFENGSLKDLLPELVDLEGTETRMGFAHKNNFQHTVEVVENTYYITDNIWLRLVALLHDIGKKDAKSFDPKIGFSFVDHEKIGANMIKPIFKRLELPWKYFEYVVKLVRYHGEPKLLIKAGNVRDCRILAFAKHFTSDELKDLMLFARCDLTTKVCSRKANYIKQYEDLYERMLMVLNKHEESLWRPPINGNDIMEHLGIPKGQKLFEGQKKLKKLQYLKKEVTRAIKAGEVEETYDDAYDYMVKKGVDYDREMV